MFSERADLAAYIKSCSDRLVVFDGRCGAGKTSAMWTMRDALGLRCIDGDKFRTPERERDYLRPFIDSFQFNELKAEIDPVLRRSNATVLLSTVCARRVVVLADLPKATFIYVERTPRTQLDIYKRDFTDDITAPDVDRSKEEDRLPWEVEEYHRDYSPRARADAVYFSVRD